MHGSGIMAIILPGPGAASIGAVVAVIVIDRVIRERPDEIRPRLRFAAWGLALAGGATIEAFFLGGPRTLPWLVAGAAMGGLARVAMSSARVLP